MNRVKTAVLAIATLSGTIIGVGIFSLPYITLKVGFWVMMGYFLILGFLVILVHSIFGELSLRTPDKKRLPGFAKFHLGNWGERIALISSVLGLFGAILAYLIVGGEFLENLFSPVFGGTNAFYTLLYFTVGTFIIYFGIRAIAKIEFWGLVLFFIVLILMYFKSREFINVDNLFLSKFAVLKIKNYFLPYGPILFSLWGASLIPETEEMLKGDKRLLRIAIPIAILIPIIVYIFFIYLILGITGTQTTESALTGLKSFLGAGAVNLGLFFGALATFTSFIALGLTLRNTFWYDLKIGKNWATFITCFLPLALFLLGVRSFIGVISFVGAVMLGVDGILILLMYRNNLKSQMSNVKSLLVWPLILIFVAGIIYEIIF